MNIVKTFRKTFGSKIAWSDPEGLQATITMAYKNHQMTWQRKINITPSSIYRSPLRNLIRSIFDYWVGQQIYILHFLHFFQQGHYSFFRIARKQSQLWSIMINCVEICRVLGKLSMLHGVILSLWLHVRFLLIRHIVFWYLSCIWHMREHAVNNIPLKVKFDKLIIVAYHI